MSQVQQTPVPFQSTAEQTAALTEMICREKTKRGALIPILQKAQGIYGYLPGEVQQMIADKTGAPMSEIFSIITFYSMFHTLPQGKNRISVCLGTACYVKGAGEIFAELSRRLGIENGGCTADGNFSLDACRCIGACGLAPVMTINDEVYGKLSTDAVRDILEQYR